MKPPFYSSHHLSPRAGVAALLLCLSGCAGPTTPLGAIWDLTPESVQQKKLLTDALQRKAYDDSASKQPVEPQASQESAPLTTSAPARVIAALREEPARQLAKPAVPGRKIHPRISFWPRRLVLHGRSPLRITVEDPTTPVFNGYRLIVRYNGTDVTPSFLLRANIGQTQREKRLVVENPSIRLAAQQDHEIEVFYISPSGAVTYAKYENPSCYAFRPAQVRTVGDFDPDPPVMQAIQRISSRGGLSPSFFSALVAQESGFNSQVVSWAKAMGLTQITSSAEADFIGKYSGWPRYPDVSELPVPVLKALVVGGHVNARNEWRLDPEKSIQGGVDYAIQLAERWSTSVRLAKIRSQFPDPEQAHTELVLASYHSGFNRVMTAFEKMGTLWIYSPDLREARKYVRRIKSYCEYFSAPQQPAPALKEPEEDGSHEA